MRKIKEFPSRADCLEIFDRDLANGIIVIQFTPREEDDLIVECGPLFRDTYGRNPVGLAAKAGNSGTVVAAKKTREDFPNGSSSLGA